VAPVVSGGARAATVVVEQLLGLTEAAPGLANTFVMQTSVVPVTLRVGTTEPIAASPFPFHFVVPSQDSAFVLEAEVAPADLSAARARWRALTWAGLAGIVAATLLLCAGPLVDMRRRARETSRFLQLTAALVVLIVVVRVVCHAALSPLAASPEPTPADLLLTTMT